MSAVQTTHTEDTEVARWEDEGGAIPPSSSRYDGTTISWGEDRVLAAIRYDLETGREDVSRRMFGDDAVDQVLANDLGLTLAEFREPDRFDGINGYEGPSC